MLAPSSIIAVIRLLFSPVYFTTPVNEPWIRAQQRRATPLSSLDRANRGERKTGEEKEKEDLTVLLRPP